MKKISILFLTLFLLASCSQDLVETPSQPNDKDVISHFALKVASMRDNTTKTGVTTKTIDPTTVDESQITDMWVVQYDKTTGAFIKKSYSPSVNIAAFDAPLAPSVTGTSNIYFVANIGATLPTAYTEAEFLKQIKNVTTEAGFLINGKPIASVSKFNIPMFGSVTNVTVPTSGFIDPLAVNMYRALARVDITYTVPSSLAADFTLEGVRLCNVPIGVQFAPAGIAGATATSTVPVQNYDIVPLAAVTGTNTITFYVPENQKGVGTNTALANERLKSGVTDATYIEFTGHTKGTQGGEEMGFCIYPGKDIYNDYNVTRNTKYATAITLSDISFSDLRLRLHEANCYILHPGSTINVSVMPANKSELGIQIPDVSTGWTPIVYWQTAAGLVTVSNATASKGYFTVTAPSSSVEGNALVAVTDASGNILWSWHIWVITEDFNRSDYQETLNGLTWMDRNLGAVSRSTTEGVTPRTSYNVSGGFYYQWGRKDPFIGTTVTNTVNPTLNTLYGSASAAFVPPTNYAITGIGTPTITSAAGNTATYIRLTSASETPISYTYQLNYSVRFPLLYMNNWSGSLSTTDTNGYNAWGGEYNQPKSPYDPCPEGWRVPSSRRLSTTAASPWGTTGYGTWCDVTYSDGNCFYFSTTGTTSTNGKVSYPCLGMISTNYVFSYCGNAGYYWTASLFSAGYATGQSLYFKNGTLSQNDIENRNLALPIRCVKIQ